MPNDRLTTESWGLLEQGAPAERQQVLRRIAQWGARNGLMAFIDQAVVSGVNFVTALVLARYLSTASYGQYVLLFALLLFVGGLQAALITAPLMVIAQRHAAEQRAAYYNPLWVVQLFGCLLAVLLIVAMILLGQQWRPDIIGGVPVLPAAILAGAYLIQEFVRRALFAQRLSLDGLMVDLISYGAQIVLIVVLILNRSLTLEWALWAIGLTSLAGCVFGIARLGLSLNAVSLAAIRATWHQHWDQGRWLLGSTLTQWVSGQFYFFVVAAILSPAAVGLLGASRNLVGFANIFILSLENFVPGIAAQRLRSGGLAAMAGWISRFRLALGVGMGIYCLVFAIFGEQLMGLLFGAQYSGTGIVVALLALVNFLMALNRPSMFALRAMEQSRWIFYTHLATSLVTLIISMPLVSAAGVLGAASGLVLTQTLVLLIASMAYWRAVKRPEPAGAPL
jgi:O-antigen/teichoic acid export membrane protein